MKLTITLMNLILFSQMILWLIMMILCMMI